MKKKLILSNTEHSEQFTITIYKNRIIDYTGITNNRLLYDEKERIRTHNINSRFEIFPLDKFEKIEHEVNAKYIIRNESLEYVLQGVGLYIDLNTFEYLRINWYNKKYLIQSKEIKTDVLKYIIGGIIGFIGGIFIQLLKDSKMDDSKKKSKEEKNIVITPKKMNLKENQNQKPDVK